MPWATFQQGSQYCVYKLDADNEKTGESLGCHPSRAEAQRQVAALYAAEKKSEKAGARHSSNDNTLIQKAHDMLCELGAKCAIPSGYGPMEDKVAIFKDGSGKYRWLSFSSSAFRDRDKEIISTKALTDDVERADKEGEYGPLRFWHEPGVDIGYADFNAMEGRVLVESGGFHDEKIGETLKEHAEEIGLSIGFIHPPDQPDKHGVFTKIHRFERSILPIEMASNLLSTEFVVKEYREMDEKKKSLLEKWIGPDLAAKFINRAEETQKAAEEAGLAFKQTETVITETVKAEEDEEKRPAFLTEDAVKALINKAFAEYDERKSAATKEAQEAGNKEVLTTLKAIQDGQAELGEAIKVALTGVAELKGELPRKLGEKQAAFVPSQNGAAPGNQFAEAVKALQEGNAQLSNAGDPFAKFTNALLQGGQSPFVNPNQPKGS